MKDEGRAMPPVHKFKGLMTGNIYLIEDEELVLVDSGAPMDSRLVLRHLKRLGRSPDELGHIFITHFHVDHAGAAAALKKASGAVVYAHEADAPFLQGDASVPSVYKRGVVGRAASAVPRVSRRMADVPEVEVDVWLKDGDEVPILGGLRVIHAPGHTPGNCCYFWARRDVLFSGDAIINTFHVLTLPTNGFSCDFDLAARSACAVVDRLKGERVELLCPGHGPVVEGNPAAKLERFRKRTAGGM